MPPRLRPRALVLALAGVLVLSACGEEGAGRPPAARVNGVAITEAEFEANRNLFLFLAQIQGRQCGQPEADESQGAACNREILFNLIQERLIRDYATANDVEPVSQQEIDEAIAPLLEGGDPTGNQAGIEEQMRSLGLDLEDLEDLARRLLLFGHVREHLGTESVSEEELRAQYEQNLLQFSTVHTKHILVETEAEAAQIAAEVTPETFEDVARERSIDPSAQENGGDLGSMGGTQLVEPFVRAALALEPGQISAPVQTEFGWHVILLVEKDVRPFEEVRSALVSQAGVEAFDEWLAQEYRTGDIEVNPRYGRFEPSTGLVVPLRSTQPGQGGTVPEETTPPAT